MHEPKKTLPFVLAFLASLPGLSLWLLGAHPHPALTALAAGTAILGASFLLLWACDALQSEISQALSLAVVSLIAVLPEYAVDMYFVWQAGQYPDAGHASYAIANMTGANRLIIGVGWAVLAAVCWLKARRPILLDEERRTEILFLGLATLYAFVIPLKGSLAWYDGLAFLALYGWYVVLAGRRPCAECEIEGPAALLAALPRAKRRLAAAALLLAAAGTILANAEPFAEGLVESGRVMGIDEFFLVQWLAPIASEAPEFVIAIMFALRGHAGLALGSLLSAKLNQWTLLVGMIPGAYALSSGSLQTPIPMGALQLDEILLTAAQSLLAVLLLARLRLTARGALLLFVLFAGQIATPLWVGLLPEGLASAADRGTMLRLWSAVYASAALWVLAGRLRAVIGLRRGLVLAPATVAAEIDVRR